MRKILASFLSALLFLVFFVSLPILTLQSQEAGGASARPVATRPSDAEIAAAKAAGKVWVNLDSGIYHKKGRWYGKTKDGRFMTVDEAKKAGYKAAKRN